MCNSCYYQLEEFLVLFGIFGYGFFLGYALISDFYEMKKKLDGLDLRKKHFVKKDCCSASEIE